jgi:uncharacterized protein
MKANKIGLLDINVLIALLDSEHEMHDAAHAWFSKARHLGWATCPITENGCVRILSSAAYPALGLSVLGVAKIFAELCAAEDHHFWPDSTTILELDRIDLAQVGPKNLTDVYLLGLAVARDGRLITFDNRIRLETVARAIPANLEVIQR